MNNYKVTLKAGRSVVRIFKCRAASDDDAKKWTSMMIKRKGFDDTLIKPIIENLSKGAKAS